MAASQGVSRAKWPWGAEEEEEVKQPDKKPCWQNEDEKVQTKNGMGQRADGYMDKGTH